MIINNKQYRSELGPGLFGEYRVTVRETKKLYLYGLQKQEHGLSDYVLSYFFFFFFKSLFILLCGEPYGREYMSSENLSIKCVRM